MKYLHKTWLKLTKKIIDDLHVGGADRQELEQQVAAHPRLWIRKGRDRGFIIMLSLECMIILELLEHNWAGYKHRLLLARYLYHHHEGARVAP